MIGWLLLGLLALVVVALAVPLRLFLVWEGGEARAWLRVLGVVTIPLYPRPPAKAKKKGKAPGKGAQAKAPPPKARKGEALVDQIAQIVDLLPSLGAAGGYLLRRLSLDRCRVSLVVGKEEAADTALAVGEAYAAAYNLYAPLCSLLRVKEFRFCALPAYQGREVWDLAARLRFSLRPCTVAAAGLLLLIQALPQLSAAPRRRPRRSGAAGLSS